MKQNVSSEIAWNRACDHFAPRHGPETFRGNVVARHYGVATDSPCGTGGLNMTSTFRVRSTHSEYTGIVRSTYTAPAILK